ncbi:MAG: NADH-quinone oxidoreductase subunit K [Calditrichia bacterium]
MLIYFLNAVLFVMGLYCLIAKKHLVKKIIGMVIMEYAINLFIILLGYKKGGLAPIFLPGMDRAEFLNKSVDPLPQVLVLTSIVIGLGILALMVAISLRLYEKYKTFDMSEIRRLQG